MARSNDFSLKKITRQDGKQELPRFQNEAHDVFQLEN